METETIVDALIQDSAQTVITLDDEDVLNTIVSSGNSCCKSCRASAYDYKIIIFHDGPSLDSFIVSDDNLRLATGLRYIKCAHWDFSLQDLHGSR